MDKNMIKIDDLLRQRLGDAEEQERPGAWLHMKDLLDQQMPVRGVPGAFNWRRMFGYLGGLVLLLAVSAGGYQALQSFNSEAPLADNTGTSSIATPATGLAGVASTTSMPQETPLTEQTAPVADVADNTLATHKGGAQHVASPTNTNPEASNNNNGNTQQVIASSGKTTKPANDATKNNKKEIIPGSGGNITPGKVAVDKPSPAKTEPVATNGSTLAMQPSNDASPAPSIAKKSAVQQNTTAERSGLVAANDNDVIKTTKNNKPAEPSHIEKEVPYNKIEIQERESKNGVVKKDTIFNGEDVMKVKVPNDKGLLALNKKDDSNSGSNMNPAASAPASNKETSDESAGMQKLGDHKIASKKMKNYNPHRFEEMVRNAKFRMGAMKFYPGIVGGINGTVNGNLGVHAGLAGNLSVSDRWSILAEVKYAHRLNFAKEKMQDDYITNVKFNNINGQGVYTYDSMEHYYNFGSYASLELPLMVTYSKDRWIYMLGANFRYNFKINNLQEVEQRYLLEQSLTSTTEPKFSTEKQILLSDFAPTLNIAPIAGIGYQALPGLRLDLRVSSSLWNNASTYGQKEISKSLHNIPQVQFNITHRFRSTKPYKRAQ